MAGMALLSALSGCNTLQRLSEIGRPPVMTATADPTADPRWRPVTMPMPRAEAAPREPASLWRSGSRAFFKDQRAAQVGDIVTVLVNTTDAANVQNATSATRTGTESEGLPNLFGLEASLPKLLGKAVNSSLLVNANSSNSAVGAGPDQAQRDGERCGWPAWSPRCCRTATWSSPRVRKCASTANVYGWTARSCRSAA